MPEEKGLFEGGGSAGSRFNLKELLFKYLAVWPLFIISLILCVGAAVLYTRYTPPKYIAFTSFLIKGSDDGGHPTNDLIEMALNAKREVNMNNEIRIISSSGLMERVVAKNSFNINYFKQAKILKTDLYLDAPFRLITDTITDYSFVRLKLNRLNSDGGIFSYGSKNEEKEVSFKWNTPFILSGKTFRLLLPNGNITNGDGGYEVTWQNVESAAAAISSTLSVGAVDQKTSVIQLSILTENLRKGKDILDALYNEFNLADIESRNVLSKNTVSFIDERLNVISTELKGVEGNLETFRGSNDLLDMPGQTSQSLTNSNRAFSTIKDINIQQNIVSMISGYFNSQSNKGKLVPSSLGINDPTLTTLIAQYNDLQLKKERESVTVAPSSLIMQDINNQSNNVKSSILESLNSISKNLKLQESNLQDQNYQYRQFLASLPRNERVLQEIKRKQSITEGLYLYLLQKREEAAISSTSSNISGYKQIDLAKGYGPVEPDTKKILIYAAILGLLLPIGWVYLSGRFNEKVTNRDDIVKSVPVPLIGDISHVARKKSKIVSAGKRDLLGEQFRIIRTNLSLLNKNRQVILITSSASKEGKSFVSINLASVLAIPGKKVALLEFDMRKPGISEAIEMDNSTGIIHYLTGETKDLSGLYHVSEDIPNLHIYSSGPIPANPADVLLNENMTKLFAELKLLYDYIIIDTAPAGLVSDAFILGGYSDTVLYIVRQRFTPKKQLDFINDMYKSDKLKNMGLLLNDVKTGSKYGYYGYGYESKNGYYTNSNTINGKKVFTRNKSTITTDN